MRETRKRSGVRNPENFTGNGSNTPNKKSKQPISPKDKAPGTAPTEVAHPLNNPKLLSIILDYATTTVYDLKLCRQVCKTWEHTTLQKWRNTAVLQIVPDTPFFQQKLFKGISISELYREFRDPQSIWKFSDFPFCRYKIKGLNIDITVCDEMNKDSGTFWQLIGPLMKYVHLEKCSFTNTEDEPFIQFLVTKLPNVRDLILSEVRLKELKMEDKPKNIGENWKTWKKCHKKLRSLTVIGSKKYMDFSKLFVLAPNLKTITGIDGETGKEITGDVILSELIDAGHCLQRKRSRSLKLKHLNLIESSSFSNCRNLRYKSQYLTDIKLKLESLTVTLKTGEKTPGLGYTSCASPTGNIDEFIHSQADTLQKLEVFRAPTGPPLPIFLSLPDIQLTALKELYLWGPVAPNFHFLKSVPSLKVLNVNLGCFEKRERVRKYLDKKRKCSSSQARYQTREKDMAEYCCSFWMEDLVHEHLETLIIDFAIPEESLRMMGEWMPNLKVIKTILDSNTVPIVCDQWKGLKELTCLFSSKIDNSSVICSKQKRGRSSRSTIGDLLELEKFQLDSICGESSLSDESVFNGFLKMPALKSIQIYVSKKMSVNAENALKKSFGNCRVIVDHSSYNSCEVSAFMEDCAAGMPKIAVMEEDLSEEEMEEEMEEELSESQSSSASDADLDSD